MPRILAGLLAPDQSSGRARRLLAGLGLLSVVLALTLVADPPGLLLLGVAAVLLTGVALYGAERRPLLRFVVVNGVAMLLLAWAASERSDLVISRTPEQLDVSVNGVRLGINLTGIDSPLKRVTVSLGATDERPEAAPWTADNLPWLRGIGDWLVGGMRGGLDQLRVTDATDTNLVPPLIGVWQPDHTGDPPRLGGSLEPWTVARGDDRSVTLVSPEVFTNRYQVTASMARPGGAVWISLGGDEGDLALDVLVAPDRRQFEIAAHPANGTPETLVGGPYVYRRSVFGWAQALLREIGRAWLVALGLVAAARLLALPFRLVALPLPAAADAFMVMFAALGLGLVMVALAGLVAVYLLEGIPHTVESIAYLFEAQVLSMGRLWVAAPPVPDFFQEAYVAATPDGRWFGVLPQGQSLLLAAGLKAGAPWLVSPIASGLAVALTVVLGRATYGTLAGVLAGLMLAFSPFVLLLSGDMLAHPAGLALVVLMLLGVVLAEGRRTTAGWLLAGLALGGLVVTRPLAAVGIGAPLMLILLFGALGTPSRSVLSRVALFGLAAAPGVVYAAAVNASLTGNPFVSPISLWSNLDRIGFGSEIGTRGGHDLASALGNTWANTAVLMRHLFGWPSYLTLALACVPFVLGTTHRWDRRFLLCAVGLAAAQWLYWSDGIMYGPRFAFEAVTALALLTARGAALLARADGTIPYDETERSPVVVAVQPGGARPYGSDGSRVGSARGLERGPTERTSVAAPGANGRRHDEAERDLPAPVAGGSDADAGAASVPPSAPLSAAPLVVTLVALLFAVNLLGYLPDLVLAYRDYNGVSRAGLKVVEEAGLENAVVFVKSDWPEWQAYGQVFLANGPLLDRKVVYARDLGEGENWRLMSKYPDWRWWQLSDLTLTEIRR